MKKNFKEKLRIQLNTWRKKYPHLKFIINSYAFMVLFVYHMGLYFVSNGRRFLCMGLFLLFFISNSSFAFWGTEAEKMPMSTKPVPESEITLLEDEEVPLHVNIIDDDEILDEYLEADYHSTDNAEQYTLDDILESNTQYASKVEHTFDETEQNLDIDFQADDWKIVLINKQHPIPDDYTFELETIKAGMQCDKRIIESLLHMLQQAKTEGINLAIRSPYRDLSRQEYLFQRKIDKYMASGMSYMDAYKYTSQAVTVPGASEHQIGLALDITSDTYATLDTGFAETKEGKWLAENSHKFGFILRYPEEKEYITSIKFEPWHFRYVGVDAATVIYQNELTLEEFWDEYVY